MENQNHQIIIQQSTQIPDPQFQKQINSNHPSDHLRCLHLAICLILQIVAIIYLYRILSDPLCFFTNVQLIRIWIALTLIWILYCLIIYIKHLGVIKMLKAYTLLDGCNPVLISSLIAFISINNQFPNSSIQAEMIKIVYPMSVFCMQCNNRCYLQWFKWNKWQAILNKLINIICAMTYFYLGVYYMNGNYKITNGYFPAYELSFKNLMLLLVFANVDLYFQNYKRISNFDGTEHLKYSYQNHLINFQYSEQQYLMRHYPNIN